MPCFDQTLTADTKQHTFDATNSTDLRMIQHLYNRLSFGARKIDIEYAHGKTIDQVVNDIIDTASNDNIVPAPDDSVFFWVYTQPYADPFGSTCQYTPDNLFDIDTGQYFNDCSTPCEFVAIEDTNALVQYRSQGLNKEWMAGMVGKNDKSNTSASETKRDIAKSFKYKLTLFWHNHFVTQNIGTYSVELFNYYYILQKNALKNLKQFTKEIGFTPMMIKYLNVYGSRKEAPNENYARELLELFTMGLNNPDTGNPNYTEDDIKAIARLLTGWASLGGFVIMDQPDNILDPTVCFKECTISDSGDNKHWWYNNHPNDTYPFIKDRHDWGTKTFLGGTVVGESNSSNQNIQSGLNEYHQLHDIMFGNRSRSIAHFICTKLYKKYVCHDIIETVQKTFINELADTFENNWEIAPVLKKLFKSEHFYDEVLMGCQIKSPVDYMVSFYRLAGLEYNTDYFSNNRHFEPAAIVSSLPNDDFGYIDWTYPNPKGNHTHTLNIITDIKALGQELFNPPNVGGWTEHQTWLNEYTYTNRWVILKKHFDNYFHDSFNSPQLWDIWESIRVFIKDLALYRKQTFSDPNLIVEAILEHFFVVNMSHIQAAAVDVFMQAVTMEEMSFWSLDSDNSYHTRQDVKDQLKDLFSYLIKQPEFNLI